MKIDTKFELGDLVYSVSPSWTIEPGGTKWKSELVKILAFEVTAKLPYLRYRVLPVKVSIVPVPEHYARSMYSVFEAWLFKDKNEADEEVKRCQLQHNSEFKTRQERKNNAD